MKVLVTSERRFKRSPDGRIWTTSIDDAQFWRRYLAVFEEVTVLARVENSASPLSAWRTVTEPGITVHPLPPFSGLAQFMLGQQQSKRACFEAVAEPTAVILRTPGNVARLLAPVLQRRKHPFGAEVVGDSGQAFSSGVLRHPLRPLLRWCFTTSLRRQCAKACALSYVTERILQERYPPGDGAFVTSYSSISLADSAFDHSLKGPPTEGMPIIIASVGSMARTYKGFDDLIKAASICRAKGWDVRLLLVGGGRTLPDLRALAEERAVPADFTGELPGPELVLDVIRRADCFVLPSKNEGLPRVIIEAMAVGLPCIGTTVGGIPELLPPEHLVSPGNVRALAECIEHLLQKQHAWASISLRNRERAMDFKESRLSEKRKRLYAEVCSVTSKYYATLGHGV